MLPHVNELLTVCMAAPRRYKNYNEQMQAEMDRMYGTGEGNRTAPTYREYEEASKPRYAETQTEEGPKIQVTINGVPARTSKGLGLFLTIFGLVYIIISISVSTVMISIGAPFFVFMVLSLFFIIGTCVMAVGIRFLMKSRKN